MSRIGNRLLTVPASVEVMLAPKQITLSAHGKSLVVKFNNHLVKVDFVDGVISTARTNSSKESHMQQGTINSLIKNALVGLTVGFQKTLVITGVGYKAAISGDNLTLSLGYSHPIKMKVPQEIELKLVSPTEIQLSSFNKELLGEFAANIRKWRKPEPYKGKGIAYAGEYILRKVGKTSEGGKKK